MSMHTYVVGFKPPDEKWRKMKEAWDACREAGVPLPHEIEKFFNYESPDENGVMIQQSELEKLGAISEFNAEMENGYEVHLDKLPKDVTIIRVCNSY
jgi:hypothetical protein